MFTRQKTIIIVVLLVLAGCQHSIVAPSSPSSSSQGVDSATAIIRTKAVLPELQTKLGALHADSSKFCNIDTLIAVMQSVAGVSVVGYDSVSATVMAEIGDNGPLIGVSAKPRPWMQDTTWGVAPDTTTLHKTLGNVVPTGASVKLLYGLDSPSYPNWTSAVKSIFNNSNRNYTVNMLPATLTNLSTVNSDDVILFYAHGSPFSHWVNFRTNDEWNLPGFSLSTFDVYQLDKVVPDGFADDYAKRRIVLMYITWDKTKSWGGLVESPVKDWAFAIDSAFVKKYWRINGNGFVCLAACHSGEACAAGMRQAIFAAGASVVSGWTNEVDCDFARKSTCFLFDRLLGANSYTDYKLTPDQRPFPKEDVLSIAMQKYNLVTDPYKNATFTFFTGGGANTFDQLAPTIKQLIVDDANNHLKIEGSFGSDPSNVTVKIGGAERSVVTFGEKEIVADLKPADYGDVQVLVSNHPSNAVQLTQWPFVVTWTMTTDNMKFKQVITITSYLRADVHKSRTGPESDPVATAVDLLPSQASLGSCTSSGTNDTATFSGTVQIPSAYTGTLGSNSASVWASYDPNSPSLLQWSMFAASTKATTVTGDGPTIQVGAAFTPTASFCYNQANADYTNKVKLGTMRIKQDLSIDENFTIAAGSIGPIALSSSSAGTLSWVSTPAQSPPAKDAQQ